MQNGVGRGCRAVSNVLGVVLLVGIVVVLMGTVGTFVFALSEEAGTESPQLKSDCDTDADVVTHDGGDEVDGDRLALRNPSYDIDDSETFTAGDELVPASASVDVTLDSGVAWERPGGGEAYFECGP